MRMADWLTKVLNGEIARIHAAERRDLNFCRLAQVFVKEPGVAGEAFLLYFTTWDRKTLSGLSMAHYYLNYNADKIGVLVSAII